MKKWLVVISGALLLWGTYALAQGGEAIFKAQGCTTCHKPAKSSKINPSLAEIAKIYQGKPEQLAQYLNGQAEAIVRPERARLMQRYLSRTIELSEADRQAVADFILQHSH